MARGLGRLWARADAGWASLPDMPLHRVHFDAERNVSVEGGYVYSAVGEGWRATGCVSGDAVWVHPSGAVAAGDPFVQRAAAPGRSLADIGVRLMASSLRFAPSGRVLYGVDEHGHGKQVDLLRREVREVAGTPLGASARLREGRLFVDHEVVQDGLAEATPAASATHLAGPGQRVWDLREGQPISAAGTVALGATCALEDGFATVDWQSHRGWRVDGSGRVHGHFHVPLDEDDTVVALVPIEGRLVAISAEGRCLDADTGQPAPTFPAPPRAGTVATPRGPLRHAVQVTVNGTTYAGSESGWLVGWTSSSS